MCHRLPAIALAPFCVFPAAALDLPTRKAGLLELRTTLEGQQAPPEIMQPCIDAATDKLTNEKFGGGQAACSKQEIRKSGSTIITESSCKLGAEATTMRAIFDGDFDCACTAMVSTTQEGGPARPQLGGKTDMIIQAKRTGRARPVRNPAMSRRLMA